MKTVTIMLLVSLLITSCATTSPEDRLIEGPTIKLPQTVADKLYDACRQKEVVSNTTRWEFPHMQITWNYDSTEVIGITCEMYRIDTVPYEWWWEFIDVCSQSGMPQILAGQNLPIPEGCEVGVRHAAWIRWSKLEPEIKNHCTHLSKRPIEERDTCQLMFRDRDYLWKTIY